MKSICIKTNSTESLNYLLKSLDNTHLNHICYSCNQFKHYKNLIIHYLDETSSITVNTISKLLSSLIIEKYEKTIIKRFIFHNYFYFDSQERKSVLEISLNLLNENEEDFIENRLVLLHEAFYKYLLNNKKIVLDGFINFRLKKYFDFLNSVIDDAVNHFIIEREYWEFISLLKVYVNSESSSIDFVHLIYNHSESILLDESKNIIEIDKELFKAKYLSDISFSSNDYTLNTLLNLVPKKIYIHLSDGVSDEFINTLQLVFEDRVEICN